MIISEFIIHYNKVYSHGNNDLFHFEPKKFIYCCKLMKKAFGNRGIFDKDYLDIDFSKNMKVPSLRINGPSQGPCGEEWSEEMDIYYCPFCGAKIKYIKDKVLKQVLKQVSKKVTKRYNKVTFVPYKE